MENLIGIKLKIVVGDPWDFPDNPIITIIKQTYKDINNKTYILLSEINSINQYIILNRYSGEDLMNILNERILTVVIYKPKLEPFSFNTSNFISNVNTLGIGSVEVIK